MTIQEKIGRIMTFGKYQDESWPLFLSINLLNIYELNIYLISFFMYRYFRNDLPEHCLKFWSFTVNKNKYSYNSPSASSIFIDSRRTNYWKFSLKYRGAQIWYNLPDDLETLKTYNSFKKGAVLSMCKIKYK